MVLRPTRYGLDLSDEGSIAFPLDTEATKGAVFERVGIDLDQASRGVGVRGYKVGGSTHKRRPITRTNYSPSSLVRPYTLHRTYVQCSVSLQY